MDTDTGIEPAGGDPEPVVEHVEDLATYGLTIHLTRRVDENLEPLTLDQLRQVISDSLRPLGYGVGIRAERTDI